MIIPMTLTQKELRAMKLASQYFRYDLSENLIEYRFLVETLIYLHEIIAEKKGQIKPWQKDSEILLYKFGYHGLTLHQILSGLEIKSTYSNKLEGNVIDISSAKAILRTQFEAFLMYHYIYVNPIDDDLKELRYNAWIYSSLIQRQSFTANTEFAKKQKENDLIEINKMKVVISHLSAFQDLSSKQQQSLLNKGSGKLFSHWATILKETGFSEQHFFFTNYTLLSIYSHSEGLSIIQLSDKPESDVDETKGACLDLYHSKLLVCLMINSITGLYPIVKKRFDSLPEQLKFDIEYYCRLAKKEPYINNLSYI